MQDLLACARKPAGVLAMIGLLVIGLPVTHGAGGSAGNYLIVVGEGLADSARWQTWWRPGRHVA
jgi:hypothetical protein